MLLVISCGGVIINLYKYQSQTYFNTEGKIVIFLSLEILFTQWKLCYLG
jgi:hypothetical protein